MPKSSIQLRFKFMEKKKSTPKTAAKKTAQKKTAENSKEKFTRLTNSIDSLSSEIETLKSNIQKEKSENTRLTSSMDALSSEIEALKLNTQKENEDTAPANSVDAIASELETLKLNIQKRKSENTTLKILFYTGLIVLLLGFMYTNSTLQRAQMDSMESSIHLLRTLMNKELLSVEKNVYQKIDILEKGVGARSKADLQESLANMTTAISRLNPDDEKTVELIDLVKKHSKELSSAYSEQENPVSP
jgi:hypothetical protein